MSVLRKVVGAIKDVAKGKRYLGMGTYKDAEGTVWQLQKDDKDFVIKRVVASKEFTPKPETTEEYWGKIFPKDMLKTLFKKKVIAHVVAEHVSEKVARVVAELAVEPADHVKLELTPCKQANCINVEVVESTNNEWLGKSAEVKLPDALKLSTLEKDAQSGLIADMAEGEAFKAFIVHSLLENGTRRKPTYPNIIDFSYFKGRKIYTKDKNPEEYEELSKLEDEEWENYITDMMSTGVTVEYDSVYDAFIVEEQGS